VVFSQRVVMYRNSTQ